jgi:hypothetical protein
VFSNGRYLSTEGELTMQRKNIRLLAIISLFMTAIGWVGACTEALAVEHAGKAVAAASVTATVKGPILIIRFNKPHVSYRDALSTVIEKLRTQGKSSNITITSFYPATSQMDVKQIKANKELAEINGKKVHEVVLSYLGGNEQIAMEVSSRSDIETNEVHLFAQ